jgi:UDP-2,3-diacylglucosamine pyrophosphatase LpxH
VALRDDRGLRYVNCGDWVESCTAIGEHEDGTLEILTWTEILHVRDSKKLVEAQAA